MEIYSALLAICVGNSPVTGEFPHKGQWRGALMFSLIWAWLNDWANNREAGDLRRHRTHYDVVVMHVVQCRLAINPWPRDHLGMRPANGGRRYNVTSSLIGWMHSQNDLCMTLRWPFLRYVISIVCKFVSVCLVTGFICTVPWPIFPVLDHIRLKQLQHAFWERETTFSLSVKVPGSCIYTNISAGSQHLKPEKTSPDYKVRHMFLKWPWPSITSINLS